MTNTLNKKFVKYKTQNIQTKIAKEIRRCCGLGPGQGLSLLMGRHIWTVREVWEALETVVAPLVSVNPLTQTVSLQGFLPEPGIVSCSKI